MTATATERPARELLAQLRNDYPDAPFLALGQTVFWDEPVKAVLRQLLDENGLGGQMVVGVHDTDYFAKTRLRQSGSGRFVLMAHNDGTTKDLWSAAGEISTLFGSETFPGRHSFAQHGVAFERVARSAPEGRQAFLDEMTEAWGWRGLVYTGSRDLIVNSLPLKEVGDGILEMLRWGFENALQQVVPGCCQDEARRVADTMLGWCQDFRAAAPDSNLTQLFQHVLPRFYALLLGHEAAGLTVDGTSHLLRFNTETASLPRFRFVDVFVNPATRAQAISAYNQAVTGSEIYTLDKFGPGALPFDLIVPDRGRGTLRLTPRVLFVETRQPIAIGLRKPIESVQELAEILSTKLSSEITLVGKAVSLVSMLAQEFIFVFNEEGSMYVRRTRKMNDLLAAQGVALDMRPILRMRYNTWDALNVGKTTLRLPEHLAATFGAPTITAPEFAANWRQVVVEQRRLTEQIKTLKKPRDLFAFLQERDPLTNWEERCTAYLHAKATLCRLRDQVTTLEVEIDDLYDLLRRARAQSADIQQAKGDHFRATTEWTPEATARRAEFDRLLQELEATKRSLCNRIRPLRDQRHGIERGEEALAARATLAQIEEEGERARLKIVRNALLTIEGLLHTNHRPSACGCRCSTPPATGSDRSSPQRTSTPNPFSLDVYQPIMIAPPDHIPDHRRLHVFYAFMVSLLVLMVVRLWYLQIVKGPEMAAELEMRRTRTVRRMAARGSIEDSHGRVLATNCFRFVVSVIPFEIDKNPDVLPRLAKMLHLPENELSDQIEEDTLTQFEPVPVADDVDVALLSQIEEQQLDLPGVVISRDPERYYTDNKLFTHVLGITGRVTREQIKKTPAANYQNGDYIGTEGVEKTFEAELRGKDGGQVVAVNARGRILAHLDNMPPVPGHTLRLTLDYDLQKVALDALMEELSHTGHPGSAVAIDPDNGAVLALASAPSYDLNTFRQEIGKLLKDPGKPLINRAVNSPQPNGSTFKLITAAAGLESGQISSGEDIFCPGMLRLGNRTFHCDKRSGHGAIDLEDAIGQSCDVYFWQVARRVGEETLTKWAHRFGLGESTGIDLPPTRVAKGLIPTPEWKQKTKRGPWVPGDLLNMSIGQGYVGVTTLQMANYTAALANGGTLWRPQLVREVRDVSGLHPQILRRLQPDKKGDLGLSPAHRAAIVEGMRRALLKRGTAAACAIPGLDVAGKTGTAQVTKTEDNSVFVCFAPIDHPRIAIAVLVEKGGHGSDVAAPIARRMLNQYLHLKLDNNSVPIGHHIGVD